MNRLEELIEKKFITFDELQEIEEFEGVTTEDCGMSGNCYGKQWFIVYYGDYEYNMYVN